MMDMDSVCGCGKPVKYTSKCGKGSCNKYARCPTRKELEDNTAELYSEHLKLVQAVKQFELDRKTSSMFKCFEIVEELKYGKN